MLEPRTPMRVLSRQTGAGLFGARPLRPLPSLCQQHGSKLPMTEENVTRKEPGCWQVFQQKRFWPRGWSG